jgi:hypothetical protein
MRGDEAQPAAMFSYIALERQIQANHGLPPIQRLTDRTAVH